MPPWDSDRRWLGGAPDHGHAGYRWDGGRQRGGIFLVSSIFYLAEKWSGLPIKFQA